MIYINARLEKTTKKNDKLQSSPSDQITSQLLFRRNVKDEDKVN